MFRNLLITALAFGALQAQADEVLHLKRVNFLVADLERSLSVYRDVLGFEVFAITESSPTSYSYPVFKLPPEAKLRFASLNSATEVRGFAITEVKGVELPRPAGIHVSTPVIRVADLIDKLARLREMGLEVVDPVESVNAEGLKFVEGAFVDLDGHLVVLYEFTG